MTERGAYFPPLPFIHRSDMIRADWRRRVTREIRRVDQVEHPAMLIFAAGEWLVYPDDQEGRAEMGSDFCMVGQEEQEEDESGREEAPDDMRTLGLEPRGRRS